MPSTNLRRLKRLTENEVGELILEGKVVKPESIGAPVMGFYEGRIIDGQIVSTELMGRLPGLPYFNHLPDSVGRANAYTVTKIGVRRIDTETYMAEVVYKPRVLVAVQFHRLPTRGTR